MPYPNEIGDRLSSNEYMLSEVEKYTSHIYIKLDSSPGLPWSLFHRTNASLLENNRDELVKTAFDIAIQLRDTPHTEVRKMTPFEAYSCGLMDIVKVHVKQEPHPIEKVKTDRSRIIFSQSTNMRIVEGVAFQEYQDWCIENWTLVPPKPGMGFTREHVRDFISEVRKLFPKGIEGNDVSGWDFGIKGKIIDALIEFRVRVLGATGITANFIRNLLYVIFIKVICLSDGTLLVHCEPSVMASGSFVTGAGNSEMRYLMSMAALKDPKDVPEAEAVTMGDDCIESRHERDYQKLGVRITDQAKYSLDYFNFCSHNFSSDGRCELDNWPKSLFKLLHQKYDPMFLAQFQLETRDNKNFEELNAFIRWTGWGPQNL